MTCGIKSKPILLVTYTYLADVFAGVAKGLCNLTSYNNTHKSISKRMESINK